MAKNIPEISILTDTFNTWVLRTNDLIQAVNTEVITANSTLGVTGSVGSPRNARLFGTFTATSLVANSFTITPGISGNSTTFSLTTSIAFVANSSPGTAGQVLTSSGSGVYWAAAAAGGGSVTTITAGNGIEFASGTTITSTGTIRAKAGDNSIVVNSAGISVNAAFVSSISTNASTLQNRTWAAPAAIGSTTANTGNFTTVTANATTGYRLSGADTFVANGSVIQTPGLVDATTPNSGTLGGVRIRTNGTSGFAYLQITNTAGTSEFSHFRFNSSGAARYSGAFEVGGNLVFNGTATNAEGLEVGYKIIPQIITNDSTYSIDPATSSGRYHYKSVGTAVTIIMQDNSAELCANGTTYTFVNDNAAGNMILQQDGSTILQLAGTFTTTGGNLTISPGGIATALKVAANKWVVSGTGVF